MDTAVAPRELTSDERLVAHCLALDLRRRPAARDRLEQALGPELAGRLLAALAPRP